MQLQLPALVGIQAHQAIHHLVDMVGAWQVLPLEGIRNGFLHAGSFRLVCALLGGQRWPKQPFVPAGPCCLTADPLAESGRLQGHNGCFSKCLLCHMMSVNMKCMPSRDD